MICYSKIFSRSEESGNVQVGRLGQLLNFLGLNESGDIEGLIYPAILGSNPSPTEYFPKDNSHQHQGRC